MRLRVVGCLVAVLIVGGCNSADKAGPQAARSTTSLPNTAAPTTVAVDPKMAYVARAVVPSVGVYDSPGQPEPSQTLDNPQPSGALTLTTPLVMLVREQRPDWLKVLLPVRPNGSSGWIRRSDVSIESHNFRILVELNAHTITVWKGDEVILQEPIGVGKAATGTPGGIFYTTELLQPVGQPQYGPFAYGLSGYSEVFNQFAGGPGQLGIHGTNDPSGLGRDVSNGCIRMSNEGITRLAETLPVGVPVEIRA